MNYLLYQAYGKQDIINEAIISMLSLLRIVPSLPPDLSIVVYTDNIGAFRNVTGSDAQIIYEEINEMQVREWRGKIDFVHRVKIEILKDFLSKYQGNLLYVDSDTWFLESPLPLFDKIGSGKLLMHVCEGRIDSGKNPIFKKIHRFILRNSFDSGGSEKMKIPSTAYMWNAGVLGFNSAKKDITEKVLKLTDEMYAKYPKHVMEQFAFSWFFQQDQPIEATDNIIYHYWDFKEYREHIAKFLEENKGIETEKLATLSADIAPYKLKPAPKQERSFAGKLFSFFKKES